MTIQIKNNRFVKLLLIIVLISFFIPKKIVQDALDSLPPTIKSAFLIIIGLDLIFYSFICFFALGREILKEGVFRAKKNTNIFSLINTLLAGISGITFGPILVLAGLGLYK